MVKKNGNKYRFELSIYSLIFWGLVLIVLLGWIFGLGIMVGKNQISNSVPILSNLKKPIESPPVVKPNPPSEPVQPLKKEEPPPKLEFYDVLDNKKEAPKKSGESSSNEGKSASSSTSKIKFEPLRKETLLPTEQPAAGAQSSKKETVSGNGTQQYTVQLASLESREKAEKMVQSLKAHSHAAYFYEAKIQGKNYYRVRCGRFNSREEASLYAVKLSSEENLQGFITKIE